MRDESEEGMKKVLDLPGRAQVVYITNKYIRGSFSWGNRSIVRCYTRKMLDYTEAREAGDWSLCVVVVESLASQPGQSITQDFWMDPTIRKEVCEPVCGSGGGYLFVGCCAVYALLLEKSWG